MTTTANETMTTFTCHAPDAEHVFVAGTFNQWSEVTTPLKKNRQGKWTMKMKLLPGRHEYKFIVDGEWCCEPGCDGPYHGCPGCVANKFGTMNRVIEVK